VIEKRSLILQFGSPVDALFLSMKHLQQSKLIGFSAILALSG
jgi:hypothetical protein